VDIYTIVVVWSVVVGEVKHAVTLEYHCSFASRSEGAVERDVHVLCRRVDLRS